MTALTLFIKERLCILQIVHLIPSPIFLGFSLIKHSRSVWYKFYMMVNFISFQ